ncbi:hypothetical protein ROLI_046960 (plasmid) [Roseobacter fucihabitans]|uniref:Uncharacterized protein n=1 Tax=Roseobacter fucihabitans TaxID=1537242 RepID=A0ABZ2C415_9RHOB|nr:hypothetical protein [Roseobacter litoralis]
MSCRNSKMLRPINIDTAMPGRFELRIKSFLEKQAFWKIFMPIEGCASLIASSQIQSVGGQQLSSTFKHDFLTVTASSNGFNLLKQAFCNSEAAHFRKDKKSFHLGVTFLLKHGAASCRTFIAKSQKDFDANGSQWLHRKRGFLGVGVEGLHGFVRSGKQHHRLRRLGVGMSYLHIFLRHVGPQSLVGCVPWPFGRLKGSTYIVHAGFDKVNPITSEIYPRLGP